MYISIEILNMKTIVMTASDLNVKLLAFFINILTHQKIAYK